MQLFIFMALFPLSIYPRRFSRNILQKNGLKDYGMAFKKGLLRKDAEDNLKLELEAWMARISKDNSKNRNKRERPRGWQIIFF